MVELPERNAHKMSRRAVNAGILGSLGLLSFGFNPFSAEFKRPKRLGTTFSQKQCEYLGLDYKETFQSVLGLNFDVMRLCCYWDEIEARKGKFDFSKVDWIIEQSARQNIELVVVVGMKSPRWPEFYFPGWVEEKYNTRALDQPLDASQELAKIALRYSEEAIRHLVKYENIGYIQVENEPLGAESVAGGRYLSFDYLSQAVGLARGIVRKKQKILLTNSVDLWPPNSMKDERMIAQSLELADAVGLNIYTKVPTSHGGYLEPYKDFWPKVQRINEFVKKKGKEAMVAEAQAEPWELDDMGEPRVVHIRKVEYPSASPESSVGLVGKLSRIGFDPVLMWGCEYWYWHLKNGRDGWWRAAEKLVKG